MLAVVAFATNVLLEVEAGVLGLKPSANQSVTQPSGNNNAANTDVQSVTYDTVKYRVSRAATKGRGGKTSTSILASSGASTRAGSKPGPMARLANIPRVCRQYLRTNTRRAYMRST